MTIKSKGYEAPAEDGPRTAGAGNDPKTLNNGWQPIETAPTEEGPSFLIRTHAFGGRETVIIQVSRFEGRLYPDALGAAIDWNNAITHAKYWMPLPGAPVGSSAPISAGSGAGAVGWQTMESAPKDGRAIQAEIPGHGADNLIAWFDNLMDCNGNYCGGWQFVSEQEPPDSWPDGHCEVWADGRRIG